MLRRLTALLFTLIVAGGALAGTPLRACDHSSGAAGMDAMGCCREARARAGEPGAGPSETCCAECAQRAPATVNDSEALRLPQSQPVQQHPPVPPPPCLAQGVSAGPGPVYDKPPSSKPAYILHLALLI